MPQSVALVAQVPAWHEFHKRARSPFFSQTFLGGTGIKKPDFPFDHRVKHFGIFCDHVTIALDEKEKLGKKAVEHLQTDPEFLLTLMERAYREHADAIARWQANDARDYNAFDNAALADAYAAYAHDLQSFGIYVTLPLFAESYFEEFLKNEFEKRFGAEAQTWFGVATDPIKDGSVLEEEMARLELAAKGELTDEALAQHVARFSWMANTTFYETYYDAQHYRSLLVDQKSAEERLKHLKSERATHRSKFDELLKKVVDEPYLGSIIRSANEAVYFRSYRTEILYGSSRFNQNLLKAVGVRLGLEDFRDVVWLYYDEVIACLTKGGKADAALIATRKNAYVFLSDYDGAYLHWDGEDALLAYAAYGKKSDDHAGVTELKGSGAFLGKVTGTAVVLDSIKDADKVKGGEILVTHATNVNFVPVLRKVIAIVTEEGGILSHAAIISRELRIPCVIGTKVATKVFKDGDVVEVDADKGIVRIL